MQWSADGDWALIGNSFDATMLLFNPESNSVTSPELAFNVLSDQVAWRADGRQAAVMVEGEDAFSNHIAIFDLDQNSSAILPTDLQGTLYPLHWLANQQLVLLQTTYEAYDDQMAAKPNILNQNIVLLGVESGRSRALISGLNLRGDLPVVSQDGRSIAVAVVRNEEAFLDVYTVQGEPLHSFEGYLFPTWSPDGGRLAAVSQRDEAEGLVIIDLDSNEVQIIPGPPVIGLAWLSSGEDLLLATPDPQGDVLKLFLFPTPANTFIELPTEMLIGEEFQIVGFSVNPH